MVEAPEVDEEEEAMGFLRGDAADDAATPSDSCVVEAVAFVLSCRAQDFFDAA